MCSLTFQPHETDDQPLHVAVIMDGNGRWAEARRRPRLSGHRAGASTLRSVVRTSRELGIRYLTLFAFSSENWNRPAAEVDGLMLLLDTYLAAETPNLADNGIELRAIGDLRRLPRGVRHRLFEAMSTTRGLTGMRLTLALSYGGRDELARALRLVAADAASGCLAADDVSEDLIARYLDTQGTPDPDLVIRTGGEHRLSNFLLWQAAYAELYVTDVNWPDFDRGQLQRALAWYHGRCRRFGALPVAG